MNVAVLHYHLNHGGVTQVIANHLRALDRAVAGEERPRVALLHGGRAEGWPAGFASRLTSLELSTAVAPRLEYDSAPVHEPAPLADQLRARLAERGFAPEKTLLHVHNHSLGKNASLAGALAMLARDGFALLLQIHDFAEDCRPRNYRHLRTALGEGDLGPVLYPQAPAIHYAALNGRDEGVLRAAGVPRARLHKLPNPVTSLGAVGDRAAARRKLAERFGISAQHRFLLYPVRPIRRKNLGETLLWSILAGPETRVGVTLTPLNPAEQTHYRRWREVVDELRLGVSFELGGEDGLPLGENLAASDLVLTTSVAEGFGLVFLEPWMADRALVGRDIPEITADFAAAGVELGDLSPRLRVPLELVGRTAFAGVLEEAFAELSAAYCRPAPSPQALSHAVAARIESDTVDFADLDLGRQERVVRAIAANPSLQQKMLELNPAVRRALSTPATERQALVARNKQAIDRGYSLATSGARLRAVYRQVLASPRSVSAAPPLRAAAILDRFLAADHFRPILGMEHTHAHC